jgi:LAO/AO transport system kinase
MSMSAAPRGVDRNGSDLARAIVAGSVKDAARVISQIENDPAGASEVLADLFRRTGSAHLVGVTGPPGAGKSTLVGGLVKELRSREHDVGVLAVDPSSPFSGGALLGDRDRMSEFTLDPKVFVRSLAARGHGGGLCAAVSDSVDVMDAMGKDTVLIETVGVGQGELEIAGLAHTVVLTLVPGYGDALQAMKAGITEIADIIVVNKRDVPGADQTARDLAGQDLTRPAPDGGAPWKVPVILASARRHEGVSELADLLDGHRRFAERSGAAHAGQRNRRRAQLLDRVVRRLNDDLLRAAAGTAELEGLVDRLEAGEIHPDTAAAELVGWYRHHFDSTHPSTKRTG